MEGKKSRKLLFKINMSPPNFEWMAYELFLVNKKHSFRFSKKKNTRFSDLNEWMSHELNNKKKYGTLDWSNTDQITVKKMIQYCSNTDQRGELCNNGKATS